MNNKSHLYEFSLGLNRGSDSHASDVLLREGQRGCKQYYTTSAFGLSLINFGRMPNGAKHYCFTLNNYSDDELNQFSVLPVEAKYMLFGKETGDNGTPHLQGIVGFHKRRSLVQVKAILSERAHFEVARDVAKSINYCRKEGDITSLGDVPVSGCKGVRKDLEDFKHSVKSGILAFPELRESHSDVFAKYPRFCIEYVRDHAPKRHIESYPLRDWQQELVGLLSEPPNSREIVFVVDVQGDSGKSWFCDWYTQEHTGCQVILPGKKADMAFALDTNTTCLFVDAPRSKQGEYIQYDFLEDVKNGRVFSGKYESGMKYLNKCHVVVMMNEEPDMTKLSEDRFKVIYSG